MYGKFVLSDTNRLHYYGIGIYIFILILVVYLYINLPVYENKLRTTLLSQSIDGIDASADKLIEKIIYNDDNFLKNNAHNMDIRKKNIDLLRDFKNRNISSIYILTPIQDKFFVWLDSAKYDKEPQIFVLGDIDINSLLKAKNSKKKQIYIQKNIKDLGFTLIKPILKDDKLIAFLVIDYNQKIYKSLTSLLSISVKMIIIFLFTIIILLSILIFYFIRNSYIKNRMYRDPESGAFYRSYLTDNYEKINFCGYYIVLADIDFFKRVNDIYGQAIGDRVLVSIIKKILTFLNEEDIFIQYGGEEFLILISKENSDVGDFKNRIEGIREMVENLNIKIKGNIVHLTISMGAFIQTESATSLQDAIHKADGALYDSKHNGRNKITYFDISDKKRIYREKLKDMIESDKLICFYQPIVTLKNNKIHHYEALLRLEDEDEIIYPDRILPDLENSYFYSRISMKIIEYNINKLIENKNLKISINLSSDDLINEAILSILRKYSYISARLLIEILETKDVNYVKLEKAIERLRLLGYKFCIDDYGSGYSNLNHLLNLSIDYLKIDGSIIRNIDKDKKAYSLIKLLSLFCQNNNIKIIAEFVENRDILDVLIDLNIEYGQGYYFDRPKPYDKLKEL